MRRCAMDILRVSLCSFAVLTIPATRLCRGINVYDVSHGIREDYDYHCEWHLRSTIIIVFTPVIVLMVAIADRRIHK